MDVTETTVEGYEPAEITPLDGTAAEATLGSNRSNNADDTEYYE